MRDLITDPDFIARHRSSPKDFTRQRHLSFPTLMLFMLNLLKGALQIELDLFFGKLLGREIPRQQVTRAAFTQARRKLRYEAFIELNEKLTEVFYAQTPIERWYGYRLVGVDGSLLRLPDTVEMRKNFGADEGEVPQARLVELYDVLNEVVLRAELSITEIGEGFHAEELLPRAQPGDVLLYDRGFPSFALLSLHRQYGIDHCMRTPLDRFASVRAFAASGETERWADIRPCAEAKRYCRRNGIDTTAVRVRLVRVELPGGEVEVLITSLGEAIPSEEFARLYHFRWGSEEAYKLQKCRAELENFSGKTVHSVYQDVFAKLLTINLMSIFALYANEQVTQRTRHRKHPYQVNRAAALSKMKHHLFGLILNVSERIEHVLRWVADDFEPVRPGRHFLRKSPGRRKPGFHLNYKRTA